MPPRFAYWTILIDNAPTAFRARDPQELLPTLNQLKRTNKTVTMQWFARGRLWESQEQERDDFQRRKRSAERPRERRDTREARGKDWRPGGSHQDPRARFDQKRERRNEREQPRSGERSARSEFDRRGPAKPHFKDRRDGTKPRPEGSRTQRDRFDNRRQSRTSGRTGDTRSHKDHPSGRPPKAGAHRRPHERRPERGGRREEIRNKPARNKPWDERPPRVDRRDERRQDRRDERRDQPGRKEQAPPPPKPERPPDLPEAPPRPEQIVIKPEPPERG